MTSPSWTITAPGVLGNDTDVEASALTAVVVSTPAHGTLVLSANGAVSVLPKPVMIRISSPHASHSKASTVRLV